ncbi:MAG: sensor histidine kinase [Synergistaceae bacterium]|nr:sensor histidine kinase [Synergistaceae bacterium]
MKKNGTLFYVTLSIFLPPIGIFMLAAAELFYSHRNIEALAELYIENFTESIAGRMEYGRIPFPGEFPSLSEDPGGGREPVSFRIPVLFALLDKEGKFVSGSERMRELVRESGGKIPTGIAGYIRAPDGEKFTAVKFPVPGKDFQAAGAIPWKDVPRAAPVRLWSVLAASMALWSSLFLIFIWRNVINPIHWLEQRVSSLKWGFEPLDDSLKHATPRVKKMHGTLVRVSQLAIRTTKTNRACMNDLVNVQEDERTKISRDIHDGPLQDVTALIQRIHLARRPDNTPEDTRLELDLAEKIAMTTVKEMRALCDFLNPPWLELGLSQALTELTERQALQYGVKIFLGVDESLNLSDSVTLAFFRVVQEAVTNSVRHGEASNIWIDIKRSDDGDVELTIQDDGHGFDITESDTADLRAEGHRGLSNMEERMTLIGGQLKVISYRGEGTCVRGLLPASGPR